jgi:hypothetical protein
MKISERYDLFLELSSDTNLCEPHDHVVMQLTIKIKISSQKAERGLIGVWHIKNISQSTSTIRMKVEW